MKKGIFILLLLCLFLASCTNAAEYRIYNQGKWQNLTREEIEETTTSTTAEAFLKLGKNWAMSDLNAAFFFTSNLLGLKEGDTFYMVSSGQGLTILDKERRLLGYYERSAESSSPVKVTLIVQGKGVWIITLSRGWENGPWLVTDLQKSK